MRSFARFLSILLIILALLSSTLSQPSSKSIFFQNVRIFDGHHFSGPLNVLVEHGKIQLVGSLVKKPANAEVISGNGLTLLPGLIDSHVHVFGSAHLTQALAFGVTTELDMFSNIQNSKSIEEDQAAGKLTDEADLRTSGILVTAPGGHGTEYGINIPTISNPDQAQWSGVMFSPGKHMMEAVDLSSKKNISFWAKGDGKTYRIMLFTQKSGPIPLTQTFTAGPEWKQFTFSISSFEGADGHGLSAVIFAAGPGPGEFNFYLDEVHIE